MKNVAVLLGSLSENSINKTLAKTFEKLGEGRLRFDYLDIAALPFYNNDLWDNPPAAVTSGNSLGSADPRDTVIDWYARVITSCPPLTITPAAASPSHADTGSSGNFTAVGTAMIML